MHRTWLHLEVRTLDTGTLACEAPVDDKSVFVAEEVIAAGRSLNAPGHKEVNQWELAA